MSHLYMVRLGEAFCVLSWELFFLIFDNERSFVNFPKAKKQWFMYLYRFCSWRLKRLEKSFSKMVLLPAVHLYFNISCATIVRLSPESCVMTFEKHPKSLIWIFIAKILFQCDWNVSKAHLDSIWFQLNNIYETETFKKDFQTLYFVSCLAHRSSIKYQFFDDIFPVFQSLSGADVIKKKQEKSSAVLIGIIAVFLVCHMYRIALWIYTLLLPTKALLNHYNYCHAQKKYHIPVAIYYFTQLHHLFLVINSSVNFVIYCIMGRQFRKQLKKTTIQWWRKISHWKMKILSEQKFQKKKKQPKNCVKIKWTKCHECTISKNMC